MELLTVQPWRKWGHDFLYVNNAAGKTLGYLDRSTGLLHVADAGNRAAVLAALVPQLGNKHVVLAGVPETTPAPSGAADLAGRVAGAAVAEQAARLSAGWFQRLVCRWLGLRTEATSWEVGARGERVMGRRLDRLRSYGWEVLHSIPLASGADIDHLVIGPGGVFTVNTKHHTGARIWAAGSALWVSGRPQQYVRNSRHEAAAAARRLSAVLGWPVQVRGVLAFVDPVAFTVREAVPDVLVTTDCAVADLLRGLPAVLSPDAVRAVFQAARRAEIWTG